MRAIDGRLVLFINVDVFFFFSKMLRTLTHVMSQYANRCVTDLVKIHKCRYSFIFPRIRGEVFLLQQQQKKKKRLIGLDTK